MNSKLYLKRPDHCMKILYIIPYIPSLVRVRSYQIIRHIKSRGHHVTLATISTNPQEEAELDRFREYCDKVILVNLPTYRSLLNCFFALPTKLPLQSVYSWDARLFSLIKDHLWDDNEKPVFDIIHVEHLRGSQYGVRLKELGSDAREQSLPPIVWDSVDCISYLFKQAAQQSQQGLKRRITQFDHKRTKQQEGWLTNLFDHVLVTSPKDKNALVELANKKSENIAIVPNGVDLDYFKPGNSNNREDTTLVISGKMSYHANVNMVLFLVQEVMPLVWSAQPDVKLWDSMLSYLQKATIAVAPIQYGAGIQNKVLEAMACATPVIASSLATSALAIESGKDLMVEDTAEGWANTILELISSPEKQIFIGVAGRQYVEKHHQWPEIAREIEAIYLKTISKRTQTLQVLT